jgi:hypothetical protein
MRGKQDTLFVGNGGGSHAIYAVILLFLFSLPLPSGVFLSVGIGGVKAKKKNNF